MHLSRSVLRSIPWVVALKFVAIWCGPRVPLLAVVDQLLQSNHIAPCRNLCRRHREVVPLRLVGSPAAHVHADDVPLRVAVVSMLSSAFLRLRFLDVLEPLVEVRSA